MKQKKAPLSEKELVEWEAGRNLLAEINEGVDQMLAGAKSPKRVVEVSEAIHARRLSGFSQSEFASKLGVSVRTYQEWEQGRRKPDATTRAYLTVIAKNRGAVLDALER